MRDWPLKARLAFNKTLLFPIGPCTSPIGRPYENNLEASTQLKVTLPLKYCVSLIKKLITLLVKQFARLQAFQNCRFASNKYFISKGDLVSEWLVLSVHPIAKPFLKIVWPNPLLMNFKVAMRSTWSLSWEMSCGKGQNLQTWHFVPAKCLNNDVLKPLRMPFPTIYCRLERTPCICDGQNVVKGL